MKTAQQITTPTQHSNSTLLRSRAHVPKWSAPPLTLLKRHICDACDHKYLSGVSKGSKRGRQKELLGGGLAGGGGARCHVLVILEFLQKNLSGLQEGEEQNQSHKNNNNFLMFPQKPVVPSASWTEKILKIFQQLSEEAAKRLHFLILATLMLFSSTAWFHEAACLPAWKPSMPWGDRRDPPARSPPP